MDVESTGFKGKQIFLIGTAHHAHDDFVIDLAFARNPLEEEAILHNFCINASNDHIITYNGASYDLPAIQSRLVSDMIDDSLPKHHTDLYNLFKQLKVKEHQRLKSMKLGYLGSIFGEMRSDVASGAVPLVYNQWTRTGCPTTLVSVLEHNVLDLLTLAALYVSKDMTQGRVNYLAHDDHYKK